MFSRVAIFLSGIPSASYLRVQTNHLVPQTLLTGERFYDFTLMVDGGILHTPLAKLRTNRLVWLGDWDSCGARGHKIFESIESNYPVPVERISYENEKDLSDFAIALETVATDLVNCDSLFVDVFAGLGGRNDHELINIFEAAEFVRTFPGECTLVLHPSLILTNASVNVYVTKGTIFSVIPMTTHEPVTVFIENAKYSGEVTLARPSHGLSNIAEGSTIRVEPRSGVVAVSLVL